MPGEETGFRVAFALLFTALTAVRGWYRWKAGTFRERVFSRAEPPALVALRWLLGLPLLYAVFGFILRPSMVPWSFLPLAAPIRWSGVLPGAGGLVLIVATHRALGRLFSPTLLLRPGHRLVTSGPYRAVRHPMYTGYCLLFLGAFLLSAGWLVGLSGLSIIASLMTLRLPREEEQLLRRFGGEYEEYRARTGRFLPRLARRTARRMEREGV